MQCNLHCKNHGTLVLSPLMFLNKTVVVIFICIALHTNIVIFRDFGESVCVLVILVQQACEWTFSLDTLRALVDHRPSVPSSNHHPKLSTKYWWPPTSPHVWTPISFAVGRYGVLLVVDCVMAMSIVNSRPSPPHENWSNLQKLYSALKS